MVEKNTAIQKSGATDAKVLAKEFGLTIPELKVITDTVAKNATVTELRLFMYVAKRTGLDPFTKQIHFVKRETKTGPVVAIQTGIDGYRTVADRSGNYAGSDDPIYDIDEVGKVPTKATVTVYKLVGGQRIGFTATARWAEYFPGEYQGFMWKAKPYLMLGKVAEALALRKAFPQDLSGVYVKEEMDKVEVPIDVPQYRDIVEAAINIAESCDVLQMPKIRESMMKNKFTDEETQMVEAIFERRFGKEVQPTVEAEVTTKKEDEPA